MIAERFSEVTFVTLPPLRVATFRAVSRTPEDDALNVLRQWAARAGISGTPRTFGFDVEVSPRQTEAGLRGYELWFVVDETVWPAPPISLHEFPGGRFATLTIHHPFDDPFAHIPAGWAALHEWVMAHGGDMAGDRLCLEEVVAHDGETDMVLYYPVDED